MMYFQENREDRDYTRTACHLHIPVVRSDKGKLEIDVVVLSSGIIFTVMGTILMSEVVLIKCLKENHQE